MHLSNDFLLDTGIILRHLRNDTRAHDLLDHLEKLGEVTVSAVTYMEILIGCRSGEEDATLLFFDRVHPVTITPEIAHKAASLIKRYPAAFGKDNPRGFPDALIAATAWHKESALVTLNTRHFANLQISELEIQIINQNSPNWVSTLKT